MEVQLKENVHCKGLDHGETYEVEETRTLDERRGEESLVNGVWIRSKHLTEVTDA
jgi:hypothetical protein